MTMTERISRMCKDVYGDAVKVEMEKIPRAKVDAVISLVRSTRTDLERSWKNVNVFLDFYGLRKVSRDPYSPKELAEKYGISRTAVSAILKRVGRRLRHPFHIRKLPFFSKEEARIAEEELKSLDEQISALKVKRDKISARLGYEPKSGSIDDLELSTRAYNGLVKSGLNMISDIRKLSRAELLRYRFLGPKSVDEIMTKMRTRGYYEQD